MFYYLEPQTFSQTSFETSPSLSFHLSSPAPPLITHLSSVSAIRPVPWLAFSSPQDKKQLSPLLEAHKMTETLQTARYLHSPLHPPQEVQSQGSSSSQEQLSVPSTFFHQEGPESTFRFQTDLSSLRSTTTIIRSGHFIGHTLAFLLVNAFAEENSWEEARLRAEKVEKTKCTEAKEANASEKTMKIFVFSFQTTTIGCED